MDLDKTQWEFLLLNQYDWQQLSEDAHKAVFKKIKPKEWDRIDYAWLVVKEGQVFCYVTVIELDSESAYWQFGGVFPWALSSIWTTKIFDELMKLQATKTKRVGFRVENDNFAMLKLALSRRMPIIGVRHYGESTVVEFVKDFEENK